MSTPSSVPSSEPLRTEFAVTVDLVVLTVRADRLHALLITRGLAPFHGAFALPGGFVLPTEDLVGAAVRELREESGVVRSAGHLEQLATYGAPGRDPRGRVVSVAYLALEPDLPVPRAGSDASTAQWVPVDELLGGLGGTGRLAFDHAQILADGVERARSKLEYTQLATAFCPPEFTVGELRQVYEAVWGVRLDPRNFHRKVAGTPGFIEATGGMSEGGRGRPAALFRRARSEAGAPGAPGTLAGAGSVALNPPMMRPVG
ncbi:8-oxo-dGTP diphosphatase [Sanguibacter gelidistatuariae]|uniref:8-oxo-dGTP diphosphatase n=1 Tax=Sanguibacter gelidistatuariae TaxID=1814289 RepID=A0A1G6GPS3_9MICO|nr:NUDIX domain-containing protein [Sanguibacter gelidistatuariae]SDB83948.1 8-oxo-dGTP diphosphatase [Sanguibacter gelidistatuariae]